MTRFYLPEYHEFEHLAIVPWPVDPRHNQIDWVEAIDTIEAWLLKYTGPQWATWAYSSRQEQEYWEACIAFKQERSKTLFLIAWSK